MKGRSVRSGVWFACILVGVLCFASAQVLAAPINFAQLNVPDFSQHEVAGWNNYCAPTAGTNVAYYFAQTHAGLRQGHPVPPPGGPGTLADIGASTNIAGNVPPGPPLVPSNMANLMGTTAAGGTTLAGLANGLDTYLETHDGIAGNAYWNTQILLSNPVFGGVGGLPFWNTLQNQLSGGAGIVLAMHWLGGNTPGGNYDTPDDYNPSDYDADSALGHAVTMVGYDLRAATPGSPLLDIHDPANNPLVVAPVRSHVWPPVVADSYTVTVNPTDISIVMGAATGVIYGAVITTPEPASWALLGSGLLALGGMAALRRRRQARP